MTAFTFPALGEAGARFQTRENLEAEVRRVLSQETAARIAAVSQEESARIAAVLQEAAARISADTELQQAIDALTTGIQLVGEWDASSGAFPTTRPDSSAIQAGDAWNVSTGGTVNGAAFVAQDRLVSLGTGGATYAGNWLRMGYSDLLDELNSALVTATGGSTARALADKLGERLSVADDGGLATAVASGRRLLLSEGVHAITGKIDSGAEPMRLHADSPEAILRRAATGGSSVVYVLDGAAGSRFERLTLDLIQDADAQTLVALASASDQHLRDVVVNGGVTWSGGVRSGGAVSLLIPSGTMSGFTVEGSTLDGLAFLLLQSNVNTASIERVRYLFNHFPTYAGVVGLFNAPAVGALNSDILLLGNSIGAAATGADFGSMEHFGSFAGHIRGGRVIGNYKSGAGSFFRSEEDARECVFVANVVRNENGNGLEFITNNIAGTYYYPRAYVVMGNALVGDDTAGTSGIASQITAANRPALTQSVILGNPVSDYAIGVRATRRADLNVIRENITRSCAIGLETRTPSLTTSHVSIDDTIPANMATGGMIERLSVRHVLDQGTTPSNLTTVVAGSAPCGFRKIDREVVTDYDIPNDAESNITLPNGNSGWNLIPLPSVYMRGRCFVFVGVDNTDYGVLIADVVWDGTTLTYTEVDRVEAGDITFTGVNSMAALDGNLRVLLTNGSGGDLTLKRLQFDFDGVYLEGAA